VSQPGGVNGLVRCFIRGPMQHASFRDGPAGPDPESMLPQECSEEWIPGSPLFAAAPGMTESGICGPKIEFPRNAIKR